MKTGRIVIYQSKDLLLDDLTGDLNGREPAHVSTMKEVVRELDAFQNNEKSLIVLPMQLVITGVRIIPAMEYSRTEVYLIVHHDFFDNPEFEAIMMQLRYRVRENHAFKVITLNPDQVFDAKRQVAISGLSVDYFKDIKDDIKLMRKVNSEMRKDIKTSVRLSHCMGTLLLISLVANVWMALT